MPEFFRGKHQLPFITEWRFRRVLSASYWDVQSILALFLAEIIRKLPAPEDNTLYIIVDGSKKEKRSKKNLYTQKGKIRANGDWFFGIRFCVLMIAWGNFRIPVNFKILYPKKRLFPTLGGRVNRIEL